MFGPFKWVWTDLLPEMSSVCDSYWFRDYHDDTEIRVLLSKTRVVSGSMYYLILSHYFVLAAQWNLTSAACPEKAGCRCQLVPPQADRANLYWGDYDYSVYLLWNFSSKWQIKYKSNTSWRCTLWSTSIASLHYTYRTLAYYTWMVV